MSNIKTLHEVCQALGVTRRGVQGYEKRGLVKPSARNKYGHLLYNTNAQRRIALIKDYQKLGFSLKEIETLIDAPNKVVKEALEKQVIRLQEERDEKAVLIDMVKRWIESIEGALKEIGKFEEDIRKLRE